MTRGRHAARRFQGILFSLPLADGEFVMPEGTPSDSQVGAIFYGDSLKWFSEWVVLFHPIGKILSAIVHV